MTKNSLGHAFVILSLCMKTGVDEFIDGLIVNPTQSLNVAWITQHPRKAAHAKQVLETQERPTQTAKCSIPQPQHIPEGVPLADEDSQAHRNQMSMFCFIQDLCVHTRLLGHYLTHQVDMWGVAQHFRDHFSGNPPATYYGCYQYSGIETPIQIGGPIQQQPHQTRFTQPTPQQHQIPFRSVGNR